MARFGMIIPMMDAVGENSFHPFLLRAGPGAEGSLHVYGPKYEHTDERYCLRLSSDALHYFVLMLAFRAGIITRSH